MASFERFNVIYTKKLSWANAVSVHVICIRVRWGDLIACSLPCGLHTLCHIADDLCGSFAWGADLCRSLAVDILATAFFSVNCCRFLLPALPTSWFMGASYRLILIWITFSTFWTKKAQTRQMWAQFFCRKMKQNNSALNLQFQILLANIINTHRLLILSVHKNVTFK